MRKWFKTFVVSVLTLATFTGCGKGGDTSTNNSASDSSITSATEESWCVVNFDLCTTLKTNKVLPQEVAEGDVLVKPSVGVIGENTERMEVEGWYTDKEYTNKWNFTMDVVESNMTLYAKWVKKFKVTYYLGEEVDIPMYETYVQEGDCVKYEPQLADGYESNGFFTTAVHETPFDFNTPITSDVNVYIHRSEHIYFSGKMIAERFRMEQNYAKGGTIEYAEDENGEGYAKMNFGYSTAADPHALLENVTVDISASQKLEVTFKNMGAATSLKFYYLNWLADGTETDGPAFNENNAFTYTYTADEKNMKEDDEWITKVFDFSKNLTNGVSHWGISATMIRLRLQSGYISENEDDRTNEVWIKSIKGITDDTYTSTEDTKAITALRVNDDATAVENVASQQEDVTGWVFPKDFATATPNDSEIYEKTGGLLFYSKFRAKNTGVNFALNDEKIDLNDLTTIRIRLTNYSYANKITLEYRNSYNRVGSKELAISPCGDTPESKEYVINMFGADRFEGNLSSLSLKYNSVGIDNAILIESIEFLDFKRIDIPGFNMNDKYVGQEDKAQFWTENSGVEYIHNGGSLLNGGTEFTVENNAYVGADVSVTNVGYKTMTLKYKDVEGVSKVKVGLTIDGVETVYDYDVAKEVKQPTVDEDGKSTLVIEAGDVKAGDVWKEIYLNLEKFGTIEKVRVTFEGTGTITMQELRFNMDTTSGVDFSDVTYTNNIIAKNWSSEIISYENSYSAASLSAWLKETVNEDGSVSRDAGAIRYYFGAMLGQSKFGAGNIDISDKSKVIIIYNNMGSISNLTLALGLTDVTEDGSWKTVISEAYSKGSGAANTLALQTNMAEGEWAAVEIDLSKYKTLENGTDGRAITNMLLQQSNPQSTENLLIRAIIVA
ncbi:MAG: hypothetical protein E7371_05125 [Clostridiales bacterium]|nr:hypothetical protein [Clostridiales bacterium]